MAGGAPLTPNGLAPARLYFPAAPALSPTARLSILAGVSLAHGLAVMLLALPVRAPDGDKTSVDVVELVLSEDEGNQTASLEPTASPALPNVTAQPMVPEFPAIEQAAETPLVEPAPRAPDPEVLLPERPRVAGPQRPRPKPLPPPTVRQRAVRESRPSAPPKRAEIPPARQASHQPASGREGQGRAAQAHTAAGGQNKADYASRVRAVLQARANALGIEDAEGSVGISFTIGPGGRMAGYSLSRPSGDFRIDRAVRAMLASVSFPPPPGGQFSASVTVRVR